MSPQVLLDTSAVAAYTRGSVAVGELIMMVADEDGHIGVPVTCVAEVYADARGVEEAMLEHLTAATPGVVVLPMEPKDAAAIGRVSRLSGLGVGHAIVAAKSASAYIATADGKRVRQLVDDERMVIDV